MPLQNRVTPLGELVADPARGLLYGNRGVLHDASGRIRRRSAGRRWIACRLEFRGWQRGPMLQPGRFTELFFLDEATAFAAGHRPCALCRHDDYRRLGAIWAVLHPGQRGADAIDRRLHGERVDGRGDRRLQAAPFDGLPDGTIVMHDGAPALVLGDRLSVWGHAGYGATHRRPMGEDATAAVITPPSLVAVLAAGWEPLLHPTAHAA